MKGSVGTPMTTERVDTRKKWRFGKKKKRVPFCSVCRRSVKRGEWYGLTGRGLYKHSYIKDCTGRKKESNAVH